MVRMHIALLNHWEGSLGPELLLGGRDRTEPLLIRLLVSALWFMDVLFSAGTSIRQGRDT